MENRIRTLRAERNWTQTALADRAGVSRQTIGSIETGQSEPSLSVAFEIAEAFGLTVEEVFLPARRPPWQRAPKAPSGGPSRL